MEQTLSNISSNRRLHLEDMIVKVQCLICGKPMRFDRKVAKVIHYYDPPQVTEMLKFVCVTPDCDNELIVEGS